MSWLHVIALATAGAATMTHAIERGDIEEASRQGVLAGTVAVEHALMAPERATRMAGIVAAPHVDDRAELLDSIAAAAGGPDRRTAIPAVRAARLIARELSREWLEGIPDDVAMADVIQWRDAWGELARRSDRWIEVRVIALEVAMTLDLVIDPTGSLDLAWALTDPDPAVRRAVVGLLPVPLPSALRGPIAATVVRDSDPLVALGAAQALCADLVGAPAKPILDVLGAPGLTRLRTIIATPGTSDGTLRDAARCLLADKTPASAIALRTIRMRLR